MSDSTQMTVKAGTPAVVPGGGLETQFERLEDSEHVRRVAIVLLALGESNARAIFEQLHEDEVERIVRVAEQMGEIRAEEVFEVLTAFVGRIDEQVDGVAGHEAMIQRAAEAVLGQDTIAMLLGRDNLDAAQRLETAAKRDTSAFAQALGREHPQVIAVVLAMLPPELGGVVLGLIPEELQPEIVKRVATIRTVPATVLAEVADLVGREFRTADDVKPVQIDGTVMAVGLLKSVGKDYEETIFEALGTSDEELAEELRSRMFVFEDLTILPPRSVQLVLREIDATLLPMALKLASSRVKEHILSNMSARAAQLVLDDLEAMPKPRVTQVEEAQQQIVAVVLQLASDEKIDIRPE